MVPPTVCRDCTVNPLFLFLSPMQSGHVLHFLRNDTFPRVLQFGHSMVEAQHNDERISEPSVILIASDLPAPLHVGHKANGVRASRRYAPIRATSPARRYCTPQIEDPWASDDERFVSGIEFRTLNLCEVLESTSIPASSIPQVGRVSTAMTDIGIGSREAHGIYAK